MGFNFLTYLELRPGASIADLIPKFQKALEDNLPLRSKPLNAKTVLGLTPSSIHLYSQAEEEFFPPGNPAYIRILALIAFFILLLAGINFVTLSIGQAGRRAKEIGIRKVLGAERRGLIAQFLGESVMLSLISLTAAIGLIYLPGLQPVDRPKPQLPAFPEPIRPPRTPRPGPGGRPAGRLPRSRAFRLQSAKHSQISNRRGPEAGLSARRIGHAQYVVSIALICCTLIVHDQLRFLRNFDLGYDKDQLAAIPLVVGRTRGVRMSYTEVLKSPGWNGPFSATPFRLETTTKHSFALRAWRPGTARFYLGSERTGIIFRPGLTLAAGRTSTRRVRPTRRRSSSMKRWSASWAGPSRWAK
ncbi:MAG: FtsX-like permease family protein [Marinilabiliales bacterium]|nr:FtsX-like permease family protein [Marinilabiliales bacterium]